MWGHAQEADSVAVVSDSSQVANDTIPKKIGSLYLSQDQSFETEVDYDAKDSIKYDLKNKKVRLYGEGMVTYGDIELKADYIEYGFTNNLVLAMSTTDTAGKVIGKPVFKDKGQEYEADTIRYNFKSRKGLIKQVSTSIANGYVFGERVKRTQGDVLYIKNASFCPCENKEAKTRIHTSKLKFIPSEKILSSAWVLKLGKVPTPLAFFFGFFPNNEKKNAGIIIPRYGDSPNLGFFLADFGWYQPLGENMDAKFMGTIYTRGSWNTSTDLRYTNRYRFSGGLNFLFQKSLTGFREIPSTFSETQDFKINWQHRQAPKARPNSNFNASVNIGTSTVNRNNLNSSAQDFLTNTFRSNINYTKTFRGKPYNFSVSASHNQNTNTGAVNIDLPQLTFNVQRLYLPLSFLKARDNGKTMWYEKIGMNYSMNFSNRLATGDSLISLRNINSLTRQMQNGIRHNVALNTSLKKWFFTFNPAINLTSRNYFRRFERRFDNDLQAPAIDTLPGFYNVYDVGFSTSVTTNVYGMFTFKKGPLKAVRHLMTPTASFFYRPGNDYRKYGFVGNEGAYTSYTPFDGAIYGTPAPQESGGLNLSLANNLEAKVRDRSDTTGTGTKKIKLIEAFNLNASHDFLRDSVKWSTIGVNARTVVLQSLSLNYAAVLDPYGYDANGQTINASLLKQRNQLVRMASQTFAVNYSYRAGMYKDKSKKKQERDSTFINNLYYGIVPEITVGYNYSINQQFDAEMGDFIKNTTPHTVTVSGGFNFFEKVRLRYSTGFDFIAKEFSFTQFNVYLDLNCWEFSANLVPFGNIRSYSVSLNMKSALLKDVKLERNRSFNRDAQF